MAEARRNARRVYVHTQFKIQPFVQYTGRPQSYKTWTHNRMSKALMAVANGSSIRRAAEEHGVPRSTLHDRVNGRVTHGAKSGPRKYLTTLEEDQLVAHLQNCASIGYGKSRKDTLALVQAVVEKKGIVAQVSPSWLKSFTNRHPELTLKSGEAISRARQIGASKENLESYFDLLETTLYDNDLIDRPCQIFNTDETGMPLDPKPLKVYGAVSQKNFYSVTTGNKGQVTALACVSAGGYCIPPMLIFNRKGLGEGMDDGAIPGTLFAFSPNGWIDTELFENWFFHHFLLYAPPVRPLLLLIDGHSSHYSPNFVNRAAEEKVIVFCLPPNSTHRTQPLDKGAFSPLKMIWREECHAFLSKNPGKVITHYHFGSIFSKAWRRAMTPSNITAGFKITGVYPINRFALLPCEYNEKQSLSERTGLKFIPFYTPRRTRKIPLPSTSTHDSCLTLNDTCTSTSPPDTSLLDTSRPEISLLNISVPDTPLPDASLPDISLSEDSLVDASLYDPYLPSEDTPLRDTNSCSTSFTAEEVAKFKKRYEEGYDILTDRRYNSWLKTFECRVLEPQTAIASFLTLPKIKYPDVSNHKPTARIITSVEFRKNLEEKEQKKLLEAERKALRKAERERKQLEKEKKQASKKQVQKVTFKESENSNTEKPSARSVKVSRTVKDSKDNDKLSKTESASVSRTVKDSKDNDKLSESASVSHTVRGSKGNDKSSETESASVSHTVRDTKGNGKSSKTESASVSRTVRGSKGNSKSSKTESASVSRTVRGSNGNDKSSKTKSASVSRTVRGSKGNDKLSKTESASVSRTVRGSKGREKLSVTDTDCLLKECEHPRAYKWVECELCKRWYHQICVGFLRGAKFLCHKC